MYQMAAGTRVVARYGAALVIVVLATVARWLLDPFFGETVPWITYFAAVALTSWLGGFGPGLCSLVLGAAVANYLFMPPRGSFTLAETGEIVSLLTYLVLGTAIVLLVESLRRAESRADGQSEWFRVTLSSIGDAVIATNGESRVILLNAEAEALTGWTREEAAGQPLETVFQLVHAESRQRVESPVGQVLRERQDVGPVDNTLLIARDGTLRPIAERAAPIRDAEGRVAGVVLVFRDIGGRRRGEEALQHLAAIVESSDDAIIGKSLEGRITSWNRAAERIFGYAADEMIGQSIALLMPPDHAEDLARILGHIRRGERVDHYQTRRRRKDGRIIDVSLTVSPIRDSEGQIIGASKIARDITVQKQVDAELKAAKEAAESANRAKDAFFATLSHELRTPLTPVLMGVGSLVADPRLPPALRDDLAVILRNAELESRLIDDMLDLSRVIQGKLELRLGPVDLHDAIRHAADACRPDLREKRLSLRLDLKAERFCVEGDGARLQQVLWNLIKNAVKFTPEGGEIAVTTADLDGFLRITVRDSGIGIDAEALPKIFDAFEQVSRDVTRQFGGLGLGLAISKAIVEAHGGTITAESEGRGRGATMSVVLSDPMPLIQECVEPYEPADQERGPLRILLVEDHADTVRIISRMLARSGHEVIWADTIAAAIEAASTPFDLLISDLGLPDGSGLELIRHFGPTPSIALSGFGMEDDVQKALASGFSAHLTKPIDFAKLEATIRRVTASPVTET